MRRSSVRHGSTHTYRRSCLSRQRRVSLCETLDRVLNKGAVITGDIVISVADVPLIYLGLNLMVSSVETMRRSRTSAGMRSSRPALKADSCAQEA